MPDTPRWVFVHDLWRRPDTRRLRRGNPLRMAAVCRVRRLAATIGAVGPAMIEELQPAPPFPEVVVGEPDAGRLRSRFAGWRIETAWLYLPSSCWRPEAPLGPTATLRELPDHPEMAAELRRDLGWAVKNSRAVASLHDGDPVAFCWVTAESPRWWDVSIETLPQFRRRGHAGRAFRALACAMADQGKLPLWGAAVGNIASARLARKLGLVPIDRLAAVQQVSG